MSELLRPALGLAALGALSGVLGNNFLSVGYGSAPNPGIYMAPTGIWFALLMAYAAWRFHRASTTWIAPAIAFAATWFAWEAAVNMALQIDRLWPSGPPTLALCKEYVTGLVAGAVGAFLTWAGVATSTPAARQTSAVATIVLTGALFGLLLPSTNHFDTGIVLLVPWQAAVAAAFGLTISPATAARQPSPAQAAGL